MLAYVIFFMYLCGVKSNNYIEIHIRGKVGNEDLRPDTYDIRELRDMIDIVCGVMGHTYKSEDLISLEIQEGSVRQFFYSTEQQVVVAATLLQLVASNPHMDNIEDKLASHIEAIQSKAISQGYTYEIGTSENSNSLLISPFTSYKRLEAQWVDADYYLYGTVENAGGAKDGTIRLRHKGELLTIGVDKDMLASLEKNIVYHECGVYVKGRQNVVTYEMDKSSLKLVSFLDYTKRYNEQYLEECIRKASPVWADVKDPVLWLHEMRGDYEG